MTPDYKNIAYRQHKDQIDLVNNVFNGVDTAVTHLKKYNKETDEDFKDRKDTATLNNFVNRVITSIQNIVFRQDADVSSLEGTSIEPYLDSIDLTNSANEFAKNLIKAYERDGKAYILVDAPPRTEDIQTRADELARGVRPYLKLVERKDVINWKYDSLNRLERVTIQEAVIEELEDSFEEDVIEQYRVLYASGLVEVWRDNEIYETYEVNYPSIPLIEVGDLDVPPLYDLARININHMNRASELNNYVRIGGAPVPVSWGLNAQDGEIQVIGVNQGINFTGNKNETGFEWVEMSGQNADMIRKQIEQDEKAMLDISVSLVTANQPRTATEVKADNLENESRLTATAYIIEEAMNKALQFFAFYQNTELPEDARIVINKDFDSNKLTDEEVKEYRADYMAGIISWDTLIEVLITGKRYKEMTDLEKETEKTRLTDLGV